jgi:hypothetical protein
MRADCILHVTIHRSHILKPGHVTEPFSPQVFVSSIQHICLRVGKRVLWDERLFHDAHSWPFLQREEYESFFYNQNEV